MQNEFSPHGFTSVPVDIFEYKYDQESSLFSSGVSEKKPENDQSVGEIHLAQDDLGYRRICILHALADVHITTGYQGDIDEATFQSLARFAQRVVGNSLVNRTFASVSKEEHIKTLALSAEAVQKMRKQWYRRLFLPKKVKVLLESIEEEEQWFGKLRCPGMDISREELRTVAFKMADEALTISADKLKERTKLHEEIHAIEYTRSYHVWDKIKLMLDVIFDKYHYDYEYYYPRNPDEKTAKNRIRLIELDSQRKSLQEAEAILHEMFGRRVIGAPDKQESAGFDLHIWQMRLANLLSEAIMTFEGKPGLVKAISKSQKIGGVRNLGEYENATLILLMGDEILTDTGYSFVDWAKIVPSQKRLEGDSWFTYGREKVDSEAVVGVIVQKGIESVQHPNVFAQKLIDSDIKSKIVAKLQQKYLQIMKLLLSIRAETPRMIPSSITAEDFEYLEQMIKKFE